MKHTKSFLVLVTLSALIFGACAKKDSEFAAQYKKNRMGADVADGVKTQEAAEGAAAQGIIADVVNIQKTANGATQVATAIIMVNDLQVPVTTMHNNLDVAEGSVMVGAHKVVFHAVCGNYTCNPYYAALEVYKDNKIVVQVGVRKYFDGITGLDRYQQLTPEQAVPIILGNSFSADDLYSAKSMVGVLNGKGVGAGSSGIVQ